MRRAPSSVSSPRRHMSGTTDGGCSEETLGAEARTGGPAAARAWRRGTGRSCCLAVKPRSPFTLAHHSRPAPSSALWLPTKSSRSASCSTSAPQPHPFVAIASMDAPPQGYLTDVGICLAKIFSASRLDIPSVWQLPQMQGKNQGRLLLGN